jgi:hypothetical protein
MSEQIKISAPIARALEGDTSDAAMLIRYYQAPMAAKPEISERLQKRALVIDHAASLLRTHKVPERVVPMLQTIYGFKSRAQVFEIIRDSQIIHGAMSQINRSAERKFWYDWLLEKAKQADEKGDDKAFIALCEQARKVMGLDGDDPDFDLLTKAEHHTVIMSNDPSVAGIKAVTEERKAALRTKYLKNAAERATDADTAE